MAETIDFGIDLGTTNSSIACCRNGEVRVFQSVDLMTVTPSVVYLSKSGRMLVGRKAYDVWVQDPQNTQAEFKRWMGYNDRLDFPASGRALSAEELSAEVLKSLRGDAVRQTREEVDAAVITVPAAFGSLQCDATGRAARLAGINQAPLLQEPIAAAIAYGATPGSANQRWMIFDLGGGTLDIAIVSTRNGRLAVLEHQGNNRLGGKDIDRLIAEELLLPPLSATFRLPDRQKQGPAFERLFRALVRQAEQAKIALSTAPTAPIDLFDLGDDADGKPIELSLTLKREEMEKAIAPLIEKCIGLARRAMEGARLAKSDLDRILLVGGPTQMPVVRAALAAEISARLDHSLDPMTVVAQGAALFASTQERTTPAASTPSITPSAGGRGGAATPVPNPQAIPIELSYERASGTLQSPVAGLLPAGSPIHEVKIDADNGMWTSGWIPVEMSCFQAEVVLSEAKPVTQFLLTARDRSGRVLAVTPDRFSVTRMLPMAAPPLPHTIAIELSTINGISQFDPVFKRHCPLPAEARKTYRAERTLRPSDIEASLPIKFWEIEVSDDPQEKWWAGCVHIRAEQIRRPILESSEIELVIRIDQSRQMTVEVFVPMLNQSFTTGVYIPDPPSAKSQLQQQLELCFERLERIRVLMYELEREDLRERADMLQFRTESIYEQVMEDERRGVHDPDAALGPTENLRKIRVQLCQLEEQLETNSGPRTLARKVKAEARFGEHIVGLYGTENEKTEQARLGQQLDRYIDADDLRGIKWVQEQMRNVRGPVLERQPWFWQSVLEFLKEPGRRFSNREQAQIWISRADQAQRQRDLPRLREAVAKVWEMQPPDQVEMAREQAAQSGLRGR